MYNLFKVNDEGDLVLDKIECRTIPEFRAILQRDVKRTKYVAFAELFYIYLVHHPDSMYADLPEEARRAKAKNHVKLAADWKLDKKMKVAESTFILGLGLDGPYSAYTNTRRALYSIGDDIKLFNEQKVKLKGQLIETQEEIEEAAKVGDPDFLSSLYDKEALLLKRIMNLTTNIQTLAGDLSKNFDNLEKLKKRLAKEEGDKAKLFGGGELGNREDA